MCIHQLSYDAGKATQRAIGSLYCMGDSTTSLSSKQIVGCLNLANGYQKQDCHQVENLEYLKQALCIHNYCSKCGMYNATRQMSKYRNNALQFGSCSILGFNEVKYIYQHLCLTKGWWVIEIFSSYYTNGRHISYSFWSHILGLDIRKIIHVLYQYGIL